MSSRNQRPLCPNPTCGDQGTQAFLLVAFPLASLVIITCASVWKLPVFIYTTGGHTYKIGAEGYTGDGIASSVSGFLYAPDSAWEFPATKIPLVLLLDFVVALLLAIWLFLILPWYWYHETPPKKHVVLYPQPGHAVYRVFLATLIIMVGIGNAVIWGYGNQYRVDLKPDVFGYLSVIGCILLGTGWRALQWIVRPSRTTSYRSQSSSGQSRRQGQRRPKGSSSRTRVAR